MRIMFGGADDRFLSSAAAAGLEEADHKQRWSAPQSGIAATTQWGGPPGLPSCCPAARRENRCDSLRIWRAAIRSSCECYSNVRRNKKAGAKNQRRRRFFAPAFLLRRTFE